MQRSISSRDGRAHEAVLPNRTMTIRKLPALFGDPDARHAGTLRVSEQDGHFGVDHVVDPRIV